MLNQQQCEDIPRSVLVQGELVAATRQQSQHHQRKVLTVYPFLALCK